MHMYFYNFVVLHKICKGMLIFGSQIKGFFLYVDYKPFIHPQGHGSFQDARPFELITFDLKHLSFNCVRKNRNKWTYRVRNVWRKATELPLKRVGQWGEAKDGLSMPYFWCCESLFVKLEPPATRRIRQFKPYQVKNICRSMYYPAVSLGWWWTDVTL